jgi:membrane-associated phospholipid phosphatase
LSVQYKLQIRQSLEILMQNIWPLEIPITLFFQSLGAWPNPLMQIFSFLGRQEFYLMIMPLLYWCIDTTLGMRIGAMILLTNWTNVVFKLAFHLPRPYWLDRRVVAYSSETSFGMPSGHAQDTAAIWGLFAASQKKRWLTSLAVLVMVVVGLSRIYLGVHFTSDVLVGWTLGLCLLFIYLKIEKPAAAWLAGRPPLTLATLSLASSLLVMAVPLAIILLLRSWQLPPDWVRNAAAAAPGTAISPFNLSDPVSLGGIWLGITLGAAVAHSMLGGFQAAGQPSQKLWRYLVGIAGVFLIWSGLGKIFPHSEDLVGLVLRYTRYALVGLWISLLAPLMFRRLGLAEFGIKKKLSYNYDRESGDN